MTDLSLTIAPKSDQFNADDLIAGSRTIEITSVELTGVADQPVAIHFEGDDGRPYKPCKSMRRVLVGLWGKDGNAYVGRKMTLFRDDAVKYGGLEVGGIRISHMSHISKPATMALTATRSNKRPFTVQPLSDPKAFQRLAADPNKDHPEKQNYSPEERVDAKIRELKEKLEGIASLQDHQAFMVNADTAQTVDWLKKYRSERFNKEVLPFIKASFERNMPKPREDTDNPSEDVEATTNGGSP
jgi:hypothetical protein